MRAIRPAASAALLLAAAAGILHANVVTAAEPKNVLVLYSNNRLVPGNVAVDRGLRDALANAPERPVQLFSEFLDQPDFGGEAFEQTLTTYLREKYSARPPDAVVVVTDPALDFLLRHRADLFPGVPVVHAAVAKSFLQSLGKMPEDVVGMPTEYEFAGTIAEALRLHPEAHRLVVVTGASDRDRVWEARLRREAPAVASGKTIEFLAGLSTRSLLQRLSMLGRDSVVFTPGYFQDGERGLSYPRDSASAMAAVSTAPMYGPFDTFIGIGVVGGRMPRFEDLGRNAGEIIGQLLAGAAPTALRMPSPSPTPMRLDWRQVRRWDIDENSIPADTVVYFREQTFWEEYRSVALIATAVMLLQAGLIAALLLERRRRRRSELAVQEQRSELAHASRLAIAGELTASIAHEINQPLGAILTNADAAEMLLDSGADRRDDLRRILTDIRRDDLRASDVIRRLRALLAKHEVERKTFDFNEAVNDVASLLRAETRRRHVSLQVRSTPTVANVVGDPIQIQQVLINLVLNAMDAMADIPEDHREVVLSVEEDSEAVGVAVHDRGHGIDREHLPKLFESFFSTKHRGMGLGLSIARTIVEAHGGRIWAENGHPDGAVFRIAFPTGASAGSAPLHA